MPDAAVPLFYSYAHEDETLRDQLDTHLSLLKRQGTLSDWYDRDIAAGSVRAEEVERRLRAAHYPAARQSRLYRLRLLLRRGDAGGYAATRGGRGDGDPHYPAPLRLGECSLRRAAGFAEGRKSCYNVGQSRRRVYRYR